MGQNVRQTAERPLAYWETIRDRINAARAVNVLNRVVDGEAVPAQQAVMSWNIVNKLLPGLQAIAIQVEDRTTTNVGELLNQAAALGLDQSDLFSTPETNALITQEKSLPVQDQTEGGHPPDVDE